MESLTQYLEEQGIIELMVIHDFMAAVMATHSNRPMNLCDVHDAVLNSFTHWTLNNVSSDLNNEATAWSDAIASN